MVSTQLNNINQDRESSLNRDEHKKCLKPPPSKVILKKKTPQKNIIMNLANLGTPPHQPFQPRMCWSKETWVFFHPKINTKKDQGTIPKKGPFSSSNLTINSQGLARIPHLSGGELELRFLPQPRPGEVITGRLILWIFADLLCTIQIFVETRDLKNGRCSVRFKQENRDAHHFGWLFFRVLVLCFCLG